MQTLFKRIFANGFSYLFIGNFFTHIATFASHLIIAWLLTPEDLGRVKAVQSFIDLFIVFAIFGIPYSVLKIISEDISFDHKRKVIYAGFLSLIGVSVIVLLLAQIIASLGWFSNDDLINSFAKIYAFSIIPQSFVLYFFALFQARQKFKQLSIIQVLSKIVSIPIVIFATYTFGVKGFFYSMIFSLTLNALMLYRKSNVTLLWSRYFLRTQKALKDLLQSENRLFRYSLISFINQLISKVTITFSFLYSNYLIVDRFEFGQYGFALTIVQALQIIISTAQQYLVPQLSFLSNKPEGFKKFLFKAMVKFYPLFLSIAFVTFFIYPFLIGMFLPAYTDSVIYFRLLMIGWVINSSFSFQGIATSTLGYFNYNLVTNSIKVFLIIIVAYFLVPYFGMTGAAYTNIIVGVFGILFYNIAFFKALRGKQKLIKLND